VKRSSQSDANSRPSRWEPPVVVERLRPPLLDLRFMPFDLLVFDLDGTLIDSALDLALSVNAACSEIGYPEREHEEIHSFVGNGAPMLIKRALGEEAPEAAAEQALHIFLQYYGDHMLDNTGLYPGVAESLDAFRAAGIKMAVLTNKPENFSRRIIEGLELTDHFFQIYGGDTFDEKKPDPEGLCRLMDEAEAESSRTLMVGDSSVDILTAVNAGAKSCGVTYGLRPESLKDPIPDILVDKMSELAARIGHPIKED
jgi:phosphoglycolate phosphatase